MSQNPVRTVLCVLCVLCVLSVAPLHAKPVRVTGNGAPSVAFLVNLWERAARLLRWNAPENKEGVTIDPNGAPASAAGTTEEGTSIDPNGRP
jgi:hypothetical protein